VEALVRAFLETSGEGERPEADEIGPTLRRILEDARSTYPGVALDTATFGRHLAERVPPRQPIAAALARLHGTDLFLACACVQGDDAAIGVFERDFLGPAAAALVRAGEAPADVDDASQALRERLFVTGCKIRDYSGRGSLSGWTRISLARQHTSLQRSNRRPAPLAGDEGVEFVRLDPDLAVLRRRYASTFQGAFQDAFGRLTPEQRTILRLHFVEGLNLDRMAPMLNMSRATAGRRMLDAKRALLESILTLVGERLEATPSEVESLLTVVRSTLYGSLGALLRE
jgi:RNA polymerase sigma-70 factor (ECF subfamily)